MSKHVPLRRCMACNEQKEKKDLIRVVKHEDKLCIDLTGKMEGRGAYICKNKECIEKIIKTKRLERVLNVKSNEELYESLRDLERSL